jgi:acetyl-CoA acetyltransferase
LTVKDIDFFGLYDCFPICLIRAIEAVGLTPKGKGGAYIENKYRNWQSGSPTRDFPINTHGGLLAFGAPWEVPAMYNVIEAFQQLTGQAGDRQIPSAKRALVYGNGGIFSASAVAILEHSDG